MTKVTQNERFENAVRWAMTSGTATRESYKDVTVVRDTVARNGKTYPFAVLFRGKSAKPVSRYLYRSVEDREASVAMAKKSADEREAWKAARKAERSGAPDFAVGDVFYTSWGYDQTNVDFFEVVEKPSPHFAVVREIAAKVVEGSEGFMSCSVVPVPGEYGEDARRVRMTKGYRGGASFKDTESATAWKWDGSPKYKSWYH